MPCRIILHAGFHKTGTSSVKATLRANRIALKKHAALRLRWHMQDLINATRGYSTWRDSLTLIKVQERFNTLMNQLPRRDNLADYSAAPVLLYAFWKIMTKRYPAAEILLYLYTRAPDAWLKSAHWEHVKVSNMTMDLDAFCDRYCAAANLPDMVAEIASRVPCPVHHVALEECRDLPLGPADPLLDLCNLPLSLRAELVASPAANTVLGEDVLQAMIEANKAHPTPDARNAAKAVILKQAQTL